MPTSKQEPEAVREKIRQLENRQKILLNRKTRRRSAKRGHTALLSAGPFWKASFPKSSL